MVHGVFTMRVLTLLHISISSVGTGVSSGDFVVNIFSTCVCVSKKYSWSGAWFSLAHYR